MRKVFIAEFKKVILFGGVSLIILTFHGSGQKTKVC